MYISVVLSYKDTYYNYIILLVIKRLSNTGASQGHFKLTSKILWILAKIK